MWAAIVSFFTGVKAIKGIVDVLGKLIRLFVKTPTEKIEDDKKKLDDAVRHADETGRPG